MLIRRQGMFGPVEVRDGPEARELLLNGQVQGGSYLTPSAKQVDDELPGTAPGPVSSSAYPLGWLLAGLANNRGSGLMIGLGSGAGAVQLLHNFPQIDLTVVEIDPVIANLALKAFPLLDWYINRGQLNIVLADAQQYLSGRPDVWDFACADAYTGGQHLVADYLPKLCDRADNIYLNCIDHLGGPSMREITNVLSEHGKPPAELLKAIPHRFVQLTPFTGRSNWVITTQPVDLDLASNWLPFQDMDGRTVTDVQNDWDTMLAHGMVSIRQHL